MKIESKFYPELLKLHLMFGVPMDVLLWIFTVSSSTGLMISLMLSQGIGWMISVVLLISGWVWLGFICKKDPQWFHRRMNTPRRFISKSWHFH